MKEIKIFNIEDDNGHALLLKINLKELGLGYDIVQFIHGDELFEYLEKNTDKESTYIFLLDIRLPKYDGFSILELLKKKYKSKICFHVIMVSTTDNYEEIKRANESGVAGFFTKPVNYANLIEVINKLIKEDNVK